MAYNQNEYIRNQIERLVIGNIAEHATCLHSFLAKSLQDTHCDLHGVELPHTIKCLERHQAYALKRLQWKEQQVKAGKGDSEYRLAGWRAMTKISNTAFRAKLRLKAINELIDTLGIIPVSFGAWCVPVRQNQHDNWYSCGAIIDEIMYTLESIRRDGWRMRKVLVNQDWEKETCDYMTSTVKRRTGRERVSIVTPIPAMLLVAVKSTFRGMDSC